MFGCLISESDTIPALGAIETIARACSPRVQPCSPRAALFDASGLARVIGPPEAIAADVHRLAAAQGVSVRVSVAPTGTAAWLLAQTRSGLSVASWPVAESVAALPLRTLATLPDRPADGMDEALDAFARWGLRTLGDLARLRRADLHARMGALGVRLHQAACGEDAVPLVPAAESVQFVERIDLEWPIEGLEPLSFVLARLFDPLSAALERADRGAVVLATTLRLVTRTTHVRTLELPAPMRDARILRTLVLLDLESHPPPAGIDSVAIELGVAPGRIVQGALFTRPRPAPEQLATLLARLSALAGESRVGAPALVDSHDPRAFGMEPFEGQKAKGKGGRAKGGEGRIAHGVLRRFRLPVAVRVTTERGAPVEVGPGAGLAGGRVHMAAGPWRTSGRWWALDRSRWDRDEWDVELADGVYRLARDRASGQWAIEGVLD
jgi:protein ImuB